ncbi:MAG: hypothetical protein MK081_11060 [Flavobacteriales bacterium]|nr:hypothetical protein [Flavobacteriales bacterium]
MTELEGKSAEEIRLETCRICARRKVNKKGTLLCSLTNEAPTFEDSCPDYSEDTVAINTLKYKEKAKNLPPVESFRDQFNKAKGEAYSKRGVRNLDSYIKATSNWMFIIAGFTAFTLFLNSDGVLNTRLGLASADVLDYVLRVEQGFSLELSLAIASILPLCFAIIGLLIRQKKYWFGYLGLGLYVADSIFYFNLRPGLLVIFFRSIAVLIIFNGIRKLYLLTKEQDPLLEDILDEQELS